MKETIPSKYQCRECMFSFESDTPRRGTCPKCQHVYVDWINFEEVLNSLYGDKLYPLKKKLEKK